MTIEVTQAQVEAAERLANRMRQDARIRMEERERAFTILDCEVRADNPAAAVALYTAAAKIMAQK